MLVLEPAKKGPAPQHGLPSLKSNFCASKLILFGLRISQSGFQIVMINVFNKLFIYLKSTDEPTGLKLVYFGERAERPARPGFVAMWPETFKNTDLVSIFPP